MKRELLALGITASILLSLVALAQPTAAVLTTVDGPDEVTKHDRIVLDTSVEIRQDERIPIDSFNLVLETDDGESVVVTFAPNGTVQEITPASGVVGQGEIRIDQLRESLEITPVSSNADFGYGYQSGTNERTDVNRTFGYGYGYGYGDAQPSFRFRVAMDSTAFKHGTYTTHLSVNTDGEDGVFASNEQAFEVLVPSGIQPGEDRPARDRADDRPGRDAPDEERRGDADDGDEPDDDHRNDADDGDAADDEPPVDEPGPPVRPGDDGKAKGNGHDRGHGHGHDSGHDHDRLERSTYGLWQY